MSDWFERVMKFAVLGEKFALLADNLGRLQGKVDDHEKRLVRVETIVEIVRADGATLRIQPGASL